MSLVELLLISVGLAMDAFSVSVCKGLSMKKLNLKGGVITALFFGVFQGIMPVIGYFLGSRFDNVISSFSHWLSFALLAFIGGKMIWEAIKGDDEGETKKGVQTGLQGAHPACNSDKHRRSCGGDSFCRRKDRSAVLGHYDRRDNLCPFTCGSIHRSQVRQQI